MPTNATGRLLVATPAIVDGIFDQSVVFMLHHDDAGALGVVINQSTELSLAELLPRWSDLAMEPPSIFSGGPVEPNGFIGIGGMRDPGPNSSGNGDLVEGATPIGTSGLVSVDLDADPAIVAAVVDRLRVFRGYSGWGPGQLDGELARGGWFVVDAAASDLWSVAPESLYEQVLRRQQGDVRWFANAPTDPSVN